MNTKIILAFAIACSFSACGISTPGGYVLGTTGYLQEFNRGQKQPELSNEDRQQLSRLIKSEVR